MMTSLLLLSCCCLSLAMSQKMSHILMNMVAQDPYARNMMRLPLFQELFDIEIPPTSEPSAKQLGVASLFGMAGNGIFGGPSAGGNAPRAPPTGSSTPSQSQTSEGMLGASSWDRSGFGSGQPVGRVTGPSQFDGGYQMTGSVPDTSQNGPPQLGGSLTWPQQNNGRSFGSSPVGNGLNWPPTVPSNSQMGGGNQMTWPQQPSGNQQMGDGSSWPPQMGGVIAWPPFGGNMPGNQQMGNNIPGNAQPQWPAQIGSNQQLGYPANQGNSQPTWPSQMGGNTQSGNPSNQRNSQPTWPSQSNAQSGNPPNQGNAQPQWPAQMGGNQQMGNPPNQGNAQPQWPAQMGGNQQMGNPPNQGNAQPQWPAQMGGNQQMGNPSNQGNAQPQWPAQMGGNQQMGNGVPENNNPIWSGMARPPNTGDSMQGNNQMVGSMPGNPQMGGPMPGNNQMGGAMPGNNQMGGPMPGNAQMDGSMPGNNQMGGPMPGSNQMGGPMPGNNQMAGPMPVNNHMGGPMPGNNQMSSSPPYGISSNTRPKIPLDFIVQLYNTASNPTQGEPTSGNSAMEGQVSQTDPSTMASFSNTPRQPRAVIQAGQVILPKGPPSRNFIDRLMALGGAEGIEIV
ncbi:unnamed protein product [Lymnaea stagnalis]|uniref:Uncharacterized protein n=1 Tax=Lymnaea stagnalis TaxID=6523 RepID=A0AAV2HFB9_LYMST